VKNTKQKKVILDIINNSNNHLDAYQIYDEARKQISNISLGTVYRNLGGLENDNLMALNIMIKLLLIIILYVKSVLR
jgi:Fur family ferric uptake transcriptional regulator/Fur family peroxide stress response transcriptional regulator